MKNTLFADIYLYCSFQKNTKRCFVTFARAASKNRDGGGLSQERSRLVHTFPFSFFYFFSFFLLIFFYFLVFLFFFVYCVLILSVAVVFCYFFVLAIVVQSCRIRFKRIYLRSVAFKLFFGVVIGLVMRKPLRGKINRFWVVVIGINNYLCNQKSDILCERI